jgi:hypothetical protein
LLALIVLFYISYVTAEERSVLDLSSDGDTQLI